MQCTRVSCQLPRGDLGCLLVMLRLGAKAAAHSAAATATYPPAAAAFTIAPSLGCLLVILRLGAEAAATCSPAVAAAFTSQ